MTDTEKLLKEWNKAVVEDLSNPQASMERIYTLTKQLREAGAFPPLLK